MVLVLLVVTVPLALCQQNQNEFKQILTKETMDKWEGDAKYWRFEDGILVGEVTEESQLKHSTFFTWDERVNNFELKVDYRISSKGNSGIYYRSTSGNGGDQMLRGYQADIDGADSYTGIIYENFANRGHQILVNRGEIVQLSKNDVPISIGTIAPPKKLASKIHNNGWNEYHLIIQGNTIIQILNGQVMSILIDDYKDRITEGILGMQLHEGPPMKIEFRNLRFKNLGIQ